MPKPSSWTEDRIDQLKALWADGNSASVVGDMMGVTRNAVLGKLHRLNAPTPEIKKVLPCQRIYIRPPREIVKANARARQRRYLAKKKQSLSTNRGLRQMFRANGASTTSAAYRKHLPPLPEMTRGELRAMLTKAVQNTASMVTS